MTVGEELKRLRLDAKISLKDLATKTGFFIDYLGNIESGQEAPSAEALEKLSEHLSGVELMLQTLRQTAQPAQFNIKVIDAHESSQLLMFETPNLTKYLGESCAVDASAIKIVTLRTGATRYLARGLGALGWIINPLLGSLTAVRMSITLRWENVRGVASGAPQILHVFGLRQEDGKLWSCTFYSAASQAILSEIAVRSRLGKGGKLSKPS